MNDLPNDKKVFAFKMAAWLPLCYASYLHWLRGLLERLPPIQQIRQTLPALSVRKETTAEQALHLRLQRTSTLMEGGEVCDFRIYTTVEAP